MANRLYRVTDRQTGVVVEFMAPDNLSDEAVERLAEAEFQQQAAETSSAREAEPAKRPTPESRLAAIKEAAKQELSQASMGALGGATGLVAGVLEQKGRGPATAIEKMAQGASKAMGTPRPSVSSPAAPAAAAPAAPSIVGASGAPLTPAPGAPAGGAPLRPPAGGSAVQNYGKAFGLTDIEAQRATDMTKQAGGVHDLTTKRREAMNMLQERFPSDRFVENPRFGGLMTPEPSAGRGPRAQFVPDIPEDPTAPKQPGALRQLPPQQVVPTTPKPPGGLEQVTQLFRKMVEGESKIARGIGGALRALPIASYPLAGYSIGEDVGAIQQQLASESPDYADIALRGIGALGTGLSLHPATAPVGLPMATLAPLVAAARRKPEPDLSDLTEEEIALARRPSFRMTAPKSARPLR